MRTKDGNMRYQKSTIEDTNVSAFVGTKKKKPSCGAPSPRGLGFGFWILSQVCELVSQEGQYRGDKRHETTKQLCHVACYVCEYVQNQFSAAPRCESYAEFRTYDFRQ